MDWLRVGRLRLPASTVQRLAWLILAAGAALRLWHFAGGRSLWNDEAMIALNIVDLPLAELFGGLAFRQMAAPAWLLVEKLLFLAWPNVDYALRLPALAAGTASIFLFWRLARRLLPPGEALLALAMFALSGRLIFYSSEIKPYAFDLLLSLGLLLVSLRLIERPSARRLPMAALTLLGLACVLVSVGALFPLASTGAILFGAAVWRRDWRWAAQLAAVGLGWCAAFAAVYHLVYAAQLRTVGEMLDVYWSAGFLPPPTSVAHLLEYHYLISSLIYFQQLAYWPPLLVLAAAAGGILFLRERPWALALLAGPCLLSLVAAAAQAYPLIGRLHLFWAPPLLLLAARGAGALARSLPWPRASLGAAAAVLLAWPLSATVRSALERPPWAEEEVRPNLERLAAGLSPGDTVMVSEAAELPLLIYAPRLDLRGLRYRVTADLREKPGCALRDLAALPPRGRVWILTYHERPNEERGRARLLEGLRARGRVETAGAEPRSRLFRADLERAAAAPEVPAGCDAPRESREFLLKAASARGLYPPEVQAARVRDPW